MSLTQDNPFASPRAVGKKLRDLVPVRRPGCAAVLGGSGLLYRKILVEAPVEASIEYIGYGLRDRILVNGRLVFWRLPIMGLSNAFEFSIPTNEDPLPGRIVVKVSKLFLRMRRFELQIDGQTVYLEKLDV